MSKSTVLAVGAFIFAIILGITTTIIAEIDVLVTYGWVYTEWTLPPMLKFEIYLDALSWGALAGLIGTPIVGLVFLYLDYC